MTSKEPRAKVWVYLHTLILYKSLNKTIQLIIYTVILYKSLNKHYFQNKRVWALPKALPRSVSLEDEIPLLFLSHCLLPGHKMLFLGVFPKGAQVGSQL